MLTALRCQWCHNFWRAAAALACCCCLNLAAHLGPPCASLHVCFACMHTMQNITSDDEPCSALLVLAGPHLLHDSEGSLIQNVTDLVKLVQPAVAVVPGPTGLHVVWGASVAQPGLPQVPSTLSTGSAMARTTSSSSQPKADSAEALKDCIGVGSADMPADDAPADVQARARAAPTQASGGPWHERSPLLAQLALHIKLAMADEELLPNPDEDARIRTTHAMRQVYSVLQQLPMLLACADGLHGRPRRLVVAAAAGQYTWFEHTDLASALAVARAQSVQVDLAELSRRADQQPNALTSSPFMCQAVRSPVHALAFATAGQVMCCGDGWACFRRSAKPARTAAWPRFPLPAAMPGHVHQAALQASPVAHSAIAADSALWWHAGHRAWLCMHCEPEAVLLQLVVPPARSNDAQQALAAIAGGDHGYDPRALSAAVLAAQGHPIQSALLRVLCWGMALAAHAALGGMSDDPRDALPAVLQVFAAPTALPFESPNLTWCMTRQRQWHAQPGRLAPRGARSDMTRELKQRGWAECAALRWTGGTVLWKREPEQAEASQACWLLGLVASAGSAQTVHVLPVRWALGVAAWRTAIGAIGEMDLDGGPAWAEDVPRPVVSGIIAAVRAWEESAAVSIQSTLLHDAADGPQPLLQFERQAADIRLRIPCVGLVAARAALHAVGTRLSAWHIRVWPSDENVLLVSVDVWHRTLPAVAPLIVGVSAVHVGHQSTAHARASTPDAGSDNFPAPAAGNSTSQLRITVAATATLPPGPCIVSGAAQEADALHAASLLECQLAVTLHVLEQALPPLMEARAALLCESLLLHPMRDARVLSHARLPVLLVDSMAGLQVQRALQAPGWTLPKAARATPALLSSARTLELEGRVRALLAPGAHSMVLLGVPPATPPQPSIWHVRRWRQQLLSLPVPLACQPICQPRPLTEALAIDSARVVQGTIAQALQQLGLEQGELAMFLPPDADPAASMTSWALSRAAARKGVLMLFGSALREDPAAGVVHVMCQAFMLLAPSTAPEAGDAARAEARSVFLALREHVQLCCIDRLAHRSLALASPLHTSPPAMGGAARQTMDGEMAEAAQLLSVLSRDAPLRSCARPVKEAHMPLVRECLTWNWQFQIGPLIAAVQACAQDVLPFLHSVKQAVHQIAAGPFSDLAIGHIRPLAAFDRPAVSEQDLLGWHARSISIAPSNAGVPCTHVLVRLALVEPGVASPDARKSYAPVHLGGALISSPPAADTSPVVASLSALGLQVEGSLPDNACDLTCLQATVVLAPDAASRELQRAAAPSGASTAGSPALQHAWAAALPVIERWRGQLASALQLANARCQWLQCSRGSAAMLGSRSLGVPAGALLRHLAAHPSESRLHAVHGAVWVAGLRGEHAPPLMSALATAPQAMPLNAEQEHTLATCWLAAGLPVDQDRACSVALLAWRHAPVFVRVGAADTPTAAQVEADIAVQRAQSQELAMNLAAGDHAAGSGVLGSPLPATDELKTMDSPVNMAYFEPQQQAPAPGSASVHGRPAAGVLEQLRCVVASDATVPPDVENRSLVLHRLRVDILAIDLLEHGMPALQDACRAAAGSVASAAWTLSCAAAMRLNTRAHHLHPLSMPLVLSAGLASAASGLGVEPALAASLSEVQDKLAHPSASLGALHQAHNEQPSSVGGAPGGSDKLPSGEHRRPEFSDWESLIDHPQTRAQPGSQLLRPGAPRMALGMLAPVPCAAVAFNMAYHEPLLASGDDAMALSVLQSALQVMSLKHVQRVWQYEDAPRSIAAAQYQRAGAGAKPCMSLQAALGAAEGALAEMTPTMQAGSRFAAARKDTRVVMLAATMVRKSCLPPWLEGLLPPGVAQMRSDEPHLVVSVLAVAPPSTDLLHGLRRVVTARLHEATHAVLQQMLSRNPQYRLTARALRWALSWRHTWGALALHSLQLDDALAPPMLAVGLDTTVQELQGQDPAARPGVRLHGRVLAPAAARALTVPAQYAPALLGMLVGELTSSHVFHVMKTAQPVDTACLVAGAETQLHGIAHGPIAVVREGEHSSQHGPSLVLSLPRLSRAHGASGSSVELACPSPAASRDGGPEAVPLSPAGTTPGSDHASTPSAALDSVDQAHGQVALQCITLVCSSSSRRAPPIAASRARRDTARTTGSGHDDAARASGAMARGPGGNMALLKARARVRRTGTASQHRGAANVGARYGAGHAPHAAAAAAGVGRPAAASPLTAEPATASAAAAASPDSSQRAAFDWPAAMAEAEEGLAFVCLWLVRPQGSAAAAVSPPSAMLAHGLHSALATISAADALRAVLSTPAAYTAPVTMSPTPISSAVLAHAAPSVAAHLRDARAVLVLTVHSPYALSPENPSVESGLRAQAVVQALHAACHAAAARLTLSVMSLAAVQQPRLREVAQPKLVQQAARLFSALRAALRQCRVAYAASPLSEALVGAGGASSGGLGSAGPGRSDAPGSQAQSGTEALRVQLHNLTAELRLSFEGASTPLRKPEVTRAAQRLAVLLRESLASHALCAQLMVSPGSSEPVPVPANRGEGACAFILGVAGLPGALADSGSDGWYWRTDSVHGGAVGTCPPTGHGGELVPVWKGTRAHGEADALASLGEALGLTLQADTCVSTWLLELYAPAAEDCPGRYYLGARLFVYNVLDEGARALKRAVSAQLSRAVRDIAQQAEEEA